jgi:hypothetical protein
MKINTNLIPILALSALTGCQSSVYYGSNEPCSVCNQRGSAFFLNNDDYDNDGIFYYGKRYFGDEYVWKSGYYGNRAYGNRYYYRGYVGNGYYYPKYSPPI